MKALKCLTLGQGPDYMLTDLDDFYCFAIVVEHGGFSAAERATEIPKSKLSRRVFNLEERLGVRLIQRSSRHFAVTDIGQNIYRHAQVMMNAAQAAHEMIDHLSLEPRGVIKVSVPVDVAQNQMARILPNFLKQHPEIRVQMLVSNRRYDIINENIDLALRVRSNLDADPNLIVRKLATIEQHLYASQAYLNQMATPKHPDELIKHRILSLNDEHSDQHFVLYNAAQQRLKVPISPVMMASNLYMLRKLACQDVGIALLPETTVQEQLDQKQLVRVLPDWKAPHGIFHLVYPSKRGVLPAVRVFIDYLVEELSEH